MLLKQINEYMIQCEDQTKFLNDFKLFPFGDVLPLNSMRRFLVTLPNPQDKVAQRA